MIIPVHNAEEWLAECLQSVCLQQLEGVLVEVSLFLDSCTDASAQIAHTWKTEFANKDMSVTLSEEQNNNPKGGRISSTNE